MLLVSLGEFNGAFFSCIPSVHAAARFTWPGSNARALEKARTLPADVIIIDLEDAVAPDAKAAAREQTVAAVKAKGFGPREVVIRTNGLDTPWASDDLNAAMAANPDAVLIPKVSSPQELQAIGNKLGRASRSLAVWAMIETPKGILNIAAIAAASRDPTTRLSVFVLGTNDIAKETRARFVPGRRPMLAALSQTILAARAYGLDVLDGVYNDIQDTAGFRNECEDGRDLGFDGKTLVHPTQIEPMQRGFLAFGGRSRGGEENRRCLRAPGKQRQRRDFARRQDGRNHARRHRRAHRRARERDQD